MSSNSTKVSLWKLECSVVAYETQLWVGLVKRKGCHVTGRPGSGPAGQQAVDLWSSRLFFTSLHLLLDLIFCWQWPAGSAWGPALDCARGWRCSFAKWVLKMRETQTVACWASFIETGLPSLTIHVRSSLTSFKTSTLIWIKHFPDKKKLNKFSHF